VQNGQEYIDGIITFAYVQEGEPLLLQTNDKIRLQADDLNPERVYEVRKPGNVDQLGVNYRVEVIGAN
jgi:hypothetical protein